MGIPSILVLTLIPLALASHDEPVPERTTVTLDPHTHLVLFGTRHGNRNPEKFVDVPNRTWGKEGELELTSIGKRQAYGLGKEMRSFIGNLIDPNYLPSQAKFFSSSANRCQMTLQSAIAGLFDPVDWADWNTAKLDHWSPVPYTIDDPLLRMYSVSKCTTSDEAWDPISKDTLDDLQALQKARKDLLDYMKEKDGRDATIGNAADIADNIINMDFYNATYPDWLAHPTLPGYSAASLRAAYLSFAENHMNRCASYKPCRDMMGGLWGYHIIKSIEDSVSGKSYPRLIGYASHTEVTLATMILIGIQKSELTTSAGFVVEVRNNTSPPQVRLLQHDPHPIDDHVVYPALLVPELSSKADVNGWMPFSAFKEYVSRSSFSDWEGVCKIDNCKIQTAAQTSTNSVVAQSNCGYIDTMGQLECSQIIDTLGCDHPHTQSLCSKTCLCDRQSTVPSNLQYSHPIQQTNQYQYQSNPQIAPINFQQYSDGYTASFYFGKK